jgi:hypothetical protein
MRLTLNLVEYIPKPSRLQIGMDRGAPCTFYFILRQVPARDR